jgi:hypothetical protein
MRNAEMIKASPAKLLFQSFKDRDMEHQDNSLPQESRNAECQNAKMSM